MQTLIRQHWHHLPTQEVATLLETDLEKGLDRFEVEHRRKHFGANQLAPKKQRTPWKLFLLQFHNPLVYILIASGLIKLGMGDVVDSVVILLVVLINAGIGFFQESKAERAIEALAGSLVTEASVVRAGETLRLASTELVPGDVVCLTSGDKVPADLRLVSTRDLQVAESALTGESTSVPKSATEQLAPGTVLADRINMAYASTLVTYGQARGVVTATADLTEIGQISEMISGVQGLETPLTRKMTAFSNKLLVAILGLAALVVALGVIRGESLKDILTAAIVLAVTAIPEGLPAAVSVTLAIGVARMARHRAIIRKLPAVETLGSTSVICSDKTGTLTQNQMTVRRLVVGNSLLEVSGTGYEPTGSLAFSGNPSRDLVPAECPGVMECLLAGAVCNDGALVQDAGRWTAQGDPTEVALIVAARKIGLPADVVASRLPRLDSIPFESQNQFMATLHEERATGRRLIYLKGAAEVVLQRCSQALDETGKVIELSRERVLEQVLQMAADGMRVLAFARVQMPEEAERLSFEILPQDFTFLGLQVMIDPPRPEAIEAVAACHRAGIEVKMITGDHPGTAVAIARQLGLIRPLKKDQEDQRPLVLTGKELEALKDDQFIEAAGNTAVFARVTPAQKLRLVDALQARGEVVAMTGDGVNDGPALKQADIGIAMGITGTEVAKEAADMVLTDDNFASIREAVEEGRNVFDNLTKIIAWALPSNVGQALVILFAVLAGSTLPILPLQVLWINMTTGGVLGLFLALEPRERDLMNRPPRRSSTPLLGGAALGQVFLVGFLILVAAFGLFEWELAQGAGLVAARTVVLNTVAMVQALYLLNCRSLRHSLLSIGAFRNPWLWAGIGGVFLLQAGLTYLPFLNAIFQTTPIGWDEWLRIAMAATGVLVVVELAKPLMRRIWP